MDESLTDFHEKKTNNTGPKNTQKSNNHKNKSKRRLKQLKGQKDIRTALLKTNELISYAKEFDNVCKQSGIDVDPEQLQLAIVLSRSLQKSESTADRDTLVTYEPNSQERLGKIRTTLQQYGFKVPEIKIVPTASRKVKKRRKNYRLLTITETERNQIITDKYSQILLKNLTSTINNKKCVNVDVIKSLLFYKASDITYDCMKDIDIFYVDNLLVKYKSTGCLFRSWSEIPGRPESPEPKEDINMNFTEIECSQEELDAILSGSNQVTKAIFRSKNKFNIPSINNACNKIDADNNDDSALKEDKVCNTNSVTNSKEISEDIIELVNFQPESHTIALQDSRSYSPDIFDDEISVIDCTKTTEIKSQEVKGVEESNCYMDLTNCVNVPCKDLIIEHTLKPNSQLSQNSDATKRKSNDFMEMTECIASSSHPIVHVHENVDLTQNYNHHENSIDEIVCMDLTQSSNTSDEFPFVEIDSQQQKYLDDTIILNDNEYLDINKAKNTQAIVELDSEDQDLTSRKSANQAKSKNKINHAYVFEDYIHDHSDKSKDLTESDIHDESQKIEQNVDPIMENVNNDIDLTQSSTSDTDEKNVNSLPATPKISCNNSSLGKKDNISIDYDDLFDSIQKSAVSIGANNPDATLNDTSPKSNVVDNTSEDVQIRNPSINTSITPSDLSQNSEIFEIVDQEFDYSLHKSRLDNPMDDFNASNVDEMLYDNISNGNSSSSSKSSEAVLKENTLHKSRGHIPDDNFLFGGISIMDNFSNSSSFRKSNTRLIENNFNDSKNNSYLPVVELNKATDTNIETQLQIEPVATPTKEINKNIVSFKTPVNKNFIIKMDDVTPMQDYVSMSTPERNRELEKYGLKPFKRKRAIQLLTHLYNQTHPILESYDNEELLSPSKRLKQRIYTPETSPIKKSKSPRKPPEVNNSEETEIVYEETNAVPIKETNCEEDDWIFQKREKAKVHSCRVPLHIAFHNYVSSRRGLREAILRYEPVNIDVIHKDLVLYGHRYDPKELLKFMDKNCITVKTTDNNSRNNKL